jgi:hypothetical protein
MNIHSPHVALRAALYLRGTAKPIASLAAISLWKPSSSRAHRRPTTAAPSFSA